MGAGLNRFRTTVGRSGPAAVESPRDVAAAEQKTAIKYGEGAAGEELAQKTQEDNVKFGQQQLDKMRAAGITSGGDWDRFAKMAVHGYDPHEVEAPFLAKAAGALSWLDKLGATVRFGIGDVFGLDEKQGTEFDFGTDISDIWRGDWESLQARHGEEAVGESGRFGGSDMLDAMGWEADEDNAWVNRIAHGVAGFAAEVATDPLTYVGGGLLGMGKKTAMSMTSKLVRGTYDDIGKAILKGSSKGLTTKFEQNAFKVLKTKYDDLLGTVGKELPAGVAMSDDISEQLIKGLVEEAGEQTLRVEGARVVTRDFGGLSDEFVELANSRGQGVLTGGLRLTPNPLRHQGIYVPGTRGAGRKLTRTIFGTPSGSRAERGWLGMAVKESARGTGIRGAADRSVRATRLWRDFMDRVGAENALIRSIGEGKAHGIKLWDLQQEFNATARALGTRAAAKDLLPTSKALNKAMRDAGMDDASADTYFRSILDVVQGGSDDLIRHSNKPLADAADEFVGAWKTSFAKIHDIAREAGVQLGRQDAYIPLIKSKDLPDLFTQMRDQGVVLRVADAASEEEARGMELLNIMYNAWLRRGQGGTYALGENLHTQSRLLGITLDVADMGDDMTIFQTVDGSAIKFMSHNEINQHVTSAVVKLADEYGLLINKNFTALEANPFQIANRYLNAMGDSIMEATLVRSATKSGLITDPTFRPNLGKMLANVQDKLKSVSEKRMNKMAVQAEELFDNVENLGQMKARGEVLPPLKTPKQVTRKVGDTKILIDESVADSPRVVRALEQTNRRWEKQYGPRQAQLAKRDATMKQLKKSGVPHDLAEFVSNQHVFDPVAEVFREVEIALAEEASLMAATGAEMAARTLASKKGAMDEALGQLDAVAATAKKQLVDARKEAEGAVARAKARAGIKPVRVAVVESPEAQRALADQFNPMIAGRMAALADLADNMPNGERVAAGLRRLGEHLEEGVTEGLDEALLTEISQTISSTRAMLDIMHGDTSMTMTVPEWISMQPRLQNRMPVKQQEKIMDEWDALFDVKTPPYVRTDGMTDDMVTATREAWFEGFRDIHGVDLRSLPAQARTKLKNLIRQLPADATARETMEQGRRKLLTVTSGQATDMPTMRSLQAMFIDAMEQARRGGIRKAPEWAQIDVQRARNLDPRAFYDEFGSALNKAAETDETVARIWQTHQIMYTAGMIGKPIDNELSYRLADDLEVLLALQNGQNVWRNPRLKQNLERMFTESGMGVDSTLRGTRRGFAIESREQVTTLTSYDLRRALKTQGWEGTIDEARAAIVDGTLDASKFSPDVKNTLAQMPHGDARAIDNMIDAMAGARGVTLTFARGQSPEALGKAVVRTAEAEALLTRLSRALLKRDAAGNMSKTGIREAKAILDDPTNLRKMKAALGNESERVDHMRQIVASAEALQNADPIARDLIASSNALREELMFDPEQAGRTADAILQEQAQLRTDEAFANAQGALDVYEAFNSKLRELYGMAPDASGGGRVLATVDEEAMAAEIVDDLQRYAKQLGWGDIGDAIKDGFDSRLTPTSEVADFIPSNAYGLTGAGVEGKMLQVDLEKFMSHTLKVTRAMSTPEGIAQFATGARQILHWWKGMATVAKPTFHIRNFISAAWANMQIDVRAGDYALVAKHYPALRKLYGETGSWVEAARRMTDDKARYYFENAALSGLFDATFANSEMLTKAAFRSTTKKIQRLNPLGSHGPLMQAGGIAMENVEGFHRLAAFVRHMDEGLTDPDQLIRAASSANDWVNMVHFDYNNLTAMETWAKDVIPFFVWTRRNLPLQMRTAIERPALISRYMHMVHSANDGFQGEGELGPRRYGGQFFVDTGIDLNGDTPFWARVIIDPDLPVKDLFEIEEPLSPKSWFNLITGLLGPQVQAPMKMMQESTYDVDAPVGFQAATRLFMAATDENYTQEMRPQISSKIAALMKLAWPPATEYLTAFEQSQGRMQKLGIQDGDLGSRARAGLLDLFAPGLGYSTITPHESYGVYVGSNIEQGKILSGLRKDGLIDEELDAQIQEMIRNAP